jgi:hypothetical protein
MKFMSGIFDDDSLFLEIENWNWRVEAFGWMLKRLSENDWEFLEKWIFIQILLGD